MRKLAVLAIAAATFAGCTGVAVTEPTTYDQCLADTADHMRNLDAIDPNDPDFYTKLADVSDAMATDAC